jgi:hypothetical protein
MGFSGRRIGPSQHDNTTPKIWTSLETHAACQDASLAFEQQTTSPDRSDTAIRHNQMIAEQYSSRIQVTKVLRYLPVNALR